MECDEGTQGLLVYGTAGKSILADGTTKSGPEDAK